MRPIVVFLFCAIVATTCGHVAATLDAWQQPTNATVYQITKLLTKGRTAEQLLVSCGAGCHGHSSYLAFAVVDTLTGALRSSFPHCNAAEWYPNTNPICAGDNGQFSLITHFNATGAQVALTSVTEEPECQGTLIQFPPNVANMLNAPCTDGNMLIFAPVTSPTNYNTYAYQVNVNAGTVANVTIPDIAGLSVFSVSIDMGGTTDVIVVVASANNTAAFMLNVFSINRGLLGSMPYNLVDGAVPTFVWHDAMAYIVTPLQASPAMLFAFDTVQSRPLWNASLAAIHVANAWLGPLWSAACGVIVVNDAAICLDGSTGARVWKSAALGPTTSATIHPTTGALLLGVVGAGLVALNPYTGGLLWKETQRIALTNITGSVMIVQNNQLAVTQRYATDGTMVLVGVPLNITTPTPAPPTPAPETTTGTPAPTMP